MSPPVPSPNPIEFKLKGCALKTSAKLPGTVTAISALKPSALYCGLPSAIRFTKATGQASCSEVRVAILDPYWTRPIAGTETT
jgi:hypothetical protein